VGNGIAVLFTNLIRRHMRRFGPEEALHVGGFMKTFYMVVACACTLIFVPTGATGEDRKAQTVDELAKMYDSSPSYLHLRANSK